MCFTLLSLLNDILAWEGGNQWKARNEEMKNRMRKKSQPMESKRETRNEEWNGRERNDVPQHTTRVHYTNEYFWSRTTDTERESYLHPILTRRFVPHLKITCTPVTPVTDTPTRTSWVRQSDSPTAEREIYTGRKQKTHANNSAQIGTQRRLISPTPSVL